MGCLPDGDEPKLFLISRLFGFDQLAYGTGWCYSVNIFQPARVLVLFLFFSCGDECQLGDISHSPRAKSVTKHADHLAVLINALPCIGPTVFSAPFLLCGFAISGNRN